VLKINVHSWNITLHWKSQTWDSVNIEKDLSNTQNKEWKDKVQCNIIRKIYRGADKSLAQPGRKQATATEDFDFHISYL